MIFRHYLLTPDTALSSLLRLAPFLLSAFEAFFEDTILATALSIALASPPLIAVATPRQMPPIFRRQIRFDVDVSPIFSLPAAFHSLARFLFLSSPPLIFADAAS